MSSRSIGRRSTASAAGLQRWRSASPSRPRGTISTAPSASSPPVSRGSTQRLDVASHGRSERAGRRARDAGRGSGADRRSRGIAAGRPPRARARSPRSKHSSRRSPVRARRRRARRSARGGETRPWRDEVAALRLGWTSSRACRVGARSVCGALQARLDELAASLLRREDGLVERLAAVEAASAGMPWRDEVAALQARLG